MLGGMMCKNLFQLQNIPELNTKSLPTAFFCEGVLVCTIESDLSAESGRYIRRPLVLFEE